MITGHVADRPHFRRLISKAVSEFEEICADSNMHEFKFYLHIILYIGNSQGVLPRPDGGRLNPRPAGPLDFPPPAGGGRLNAPPP